jgi:hypothetical protein
MLVSADVRQDDVIADSCYVGTRGAATADWNREEYVASHELLFSSDVECGPVSALSDGSKLVRFKFGFGLLLGAGAVLCQLLACL